MGTYHCEICGYSGQPGQRACSCEGGPCAHDARRVDCAAAEDVCPVCLDGAADPWSLIREIRAELDALHGTDWLRSVAPSMRNLIDTPAPPHPFPVTTENGLPTAEAFDPFESEWELLSMSILSIWSDLTTEELAVAAGDRARFEGLLRRRYGYGAALAHQLTNGLQDLHERFNGRWEMVAECIPRHWPEISETEVGRMNGTMGELAGLVERRYALPLGQGRREVATFLDKIDYPLLVRLFRGAGTMTPPADAASPSETGDNGSAQKSTG